MSRHRMSRLNRLHKLAPGLLVLGALVAQLVASAAAAAAAAAASDAPRAQTASEWAREFQCKLAAMGGDGDAALRNGTSREESQRRSLDEDDELRARYVASRVPWYKRFWFSLLHECNRDPHSWRFKYIDELHHQSAPIIWDATADERLANILSSTNTNGLTDLSYFKFNAGDAQLDRMNELRVAGAHVDEAQCARQLAEMTGQLDELTGLLDQLRRRPIAGELALNASGARLQPRHLRLVRALDSYGRYESGSMSAHLRLMGDYEQCSETNLEQRSGALIPMRFCWAQLNFRNQMSPLLKQRKHQPFETGHETLPVGVCLPRACHSRTLGARRELALVQKLLDSQLEMPRSLYVQQHLELESVFCLPDSSGAFGMPTSGKLCLAFALAWTLVCCAITWLRVGEARPNKRLESLHQATNQMMATLPREVTMISMKQQTGCSNSATTAPERQEECKRLAGKEAASGASKWVKMAECFNLRLSWRDFTSDKRQLSESARVDLDVLNPVKIFACIFCVAAHAALMSASVADKPLAIAKLVERDVVLQAALISSVVVDTFFVISGLLLTYITLRKLAAGFGLRLPPKRPRVGNSPASSSSGSTRQLEGSGSSEQREGQNCALKALLFLANWLVLAANRYLRLVPLYALLFWFRRDVLTYLGSGPLWDFGFNKETTNGACAREHWSMPFTFMSAFTPLSRQCLVPSWSISNDIFFGLLVPPFLLGLSGRHARATLKLMVATGVACIIGSLYAYSNAPASQRWELGELRLHGVVMLFNGLSPVYTWPLYRVPSFMIGALAGFALFKYSQANASLKEWPRWLVGPATWLAIGYVSGHTIVSAMDAFRVKYYLAPFHRLFVAHLMTLDRPMWAASNAILFLRMLTDWRTGPMMSRFASQTWRSLARLNYAALFVHWILIVLQTGISTSLTNFSHWQVYSNFVSIYLLTLLSALIVHVLFENPLDKLLKRHLFGL